MSSGRYWMRLSSLLALAASSSTVPASRLTALVLRYRTVLGALVAAGAGLIAWARVSAHVHHVQDVLAGLAVGLIAGALAVWLAGLMLRALARGTGRRGSRAVRP
jgi:membrane-associated phospholipid phosphatase